MADDEKIIRIEADVKGDDQPVSAGGQRQEQSDRVRETLNQDRQDRVQSESRHRDEVRALIDAILHGEDEALPEPPTPNVGGGGGLLLPPPPGGGGLQGPPPPPPDEPNYGRHGGALVPYTGQIAATAGGQMIRHANMYWWQGTPGTPPPTPPAATAGAAATGGAGAAGAGLMGVATAAGLAALTLAGLTVGLTIYNELLTEFFNSLVAGWREISPTVQLADARREYELLMARLRTEDRIAEPAARVTASQTEVDKEQIEFQSKLVELSSEFISLMNTFTDTVMQEVNKMMTLLTVLTWPTRKLLSVLDWALSWINSQTDLEGDDPTDEAFQKEIMGVLGQFQSNIPGMPGPGEKHNWPKPHAGQPGRFYK